MLYVRVQVAPSPIQGFGVFTLENIAQGQVVWQVTPGLQKSGDI